MAEQSRLEIAVDSRGAESNVRNVRSELGKLERAGETASRAADDVGQSFEDVARSAGMYRDASGRLREANGRFASSARQAEIRARALGGAVNGSAGGFRAIARQSQLAVPPLQQMTSLLGGISAALVTRQVLGYSDAWNNAGNQLRQVTSSADELAGVQERLMEVANTTRSDFGSTADLYSRLARSTTELGLSQSDLIGLTRTINQSMSTSGATAAEAEGAIRQLGQGLASGALRGDEFNSIAEQAPGIMRAIAESLDMTIGELRDFAAEGGITSEIVVTALQRSADAIERDFGQAVATFGQQMTVARNNMLAFVGGSDTVEEGVANIGEAIVGLSENLDDVAQAATVVAGVFGGRMAGRFITVAAGMTTAAGAATALRTALAFLGGPVGIAVAATTAMIAFREELGLVPKPVEDARKEIDLLTGSLDDLNGASIDGAMIAINAQMFELEQQARSVREQIEALDTSGSGALGFAGGSVGEQARLQAELGGIGAKRTAAEGRLDELLALRAGLGGDGGGGDGGTVYDIVPTREQESVASSVKNLGDEADDSTTAIKDFGEQAVVSAREMASAAGSLINERGALTLNGGEQINGGRSVRQRIEAGKDLRPYWLQSDDSARPTYSTSAYDAAGSAIPRAPSMGGVAQGGPNIGTLTLVGKEGGKIDVQANEPELRKFVTDLLSGASSSV